MADELHETKKQFGDRLTHIDTDLIILKQKVEHELVTIAKLPELIVDKVSRDELLTMMPDQEVIETKMKGHVSEHCVELEEKLQHILRNLDCRLVTLRKECDIDSFKLSLRSKAD